MFWASCCAGERDRLVEMSLSLRLLVCMCFIAFRVYSGRPLLPDKNQPVEQRKIMRQYQELVKELQLEDAQIQANRADFAKEVQDQMRDAIDELIGIVKNTPPSEDPGEGLDKYIDIFNKAKDLVDLSVTTMTNIVTANTEIAEKTLALQKLGQRLAVANQNTKDLVAISKRLKNPAIKLTEIPEAQPDLSALDGAIEQMRKDDLASIENVNVASLSRAQYDKIEAQLEAAYKAAYKAWDTCHNASLACTHAACSEANGKGWVERCYQCDRMCDGQQKAEEKAFAAPGKFTEAYLNTHK